MRSPSLVRRVADGEWSVVSRNARGACNACTLAASREQKRGQIGWFHGPRVYRRMSESRAPKG